MFWNSDRNPRVTQVFLPKPGALENAFKVAAAGLATGAAAAAMLSVKAVVGRVAKADSCVNQLWIS